MQLQEGLIAIGYAPLCLLLAFVFWRAGVALSSSEDDESGLRKGFALFLLVGGSSRFLFLIKRDFGEVSESDESDEDSEEEAEDEEEGLWLELEDEVEAARFLGEDFLVLTAPDELSLSLASLVVGRLFLSVGFSGGLSSSLLSFFDLPPL
jgi:hypothetical protein